ncbi:hypothetical protein KM043_007100 [Ampulex compressa]|nr:hypothetical protein KM043_007100 [Ampulex compressa]
MDQGEFVKLPIVKPTMSKTKDVNEGPTKTLNIIDGYDSRPKYPSFVRHISESLEELRQPLNINRSLGVYKADFKQKIFDIKTLKEDDKSNKPFHHSSTKTIEKGTTNECKVPLIELGAVYKILNSVIQFWPKTSSFVEAHCWEILSTIQCLIEQYDSRMLNDILSHDPSLTKCGHCGVISYTRPSTAIINKMSLSPKNVDFRAARSAPKSTNQSNNYTRQYLESKRCKFNKYKENSSWIFSRLTANFREDFKLKGNVNDQTFITKQSSLYNEHESILDSNQSYKYANDVPERCKNMVVEDNCNNKAENLCNGDLKFYAQFKVQQYRKEKKDTLQMKEQSRSPKNIYKGTKNIKSCVQTSIEIKKEVKNILQHNIENELCPTKNPNPEADITDVKLINAMKNYNKDGDRCIINNGTNVDHEKKKGNISDFAPKNMQEWPIPSSDNINSMIDTMKCLTHSRLMSANGQEFKTVLQLNKRSYLQPTCAQSKHSFVLHDSPVPTEQLSLGFWLTGEPRMSPGVSTALNWKDSKSGKTSKNKKNDSKRSLSFLQSVENDSLENCAEVSSEVTHSGESDTTCFSSSSAEDMIRKWVKPLWKGEKNDGNEETLKPRRSVTPKPSANVADHVKGRITKTILRYPNFESISCNELQSRQIDHPIDDSSKDCTRIELSDAIADAELQKREDDRMVRQGRQYVDGNPCLADAQCWKYGYDRSISALMSNESDDRDISYFIPEDIKRRIRYEDSALNDIIGADTYNIDTKIPPAYRRILENTNEMDWKHFQRLVEKLHPAQKELWRDICKMISEEAGRVKGGGSTEVCIEVSPVHCEGKSGRLKDLDNEIVFEMDMTLEDTASILDEKLGSTGGVQLDTHTRTDQNIGAQSNGL